MDEDRWKLERDERLKRLGLRSGPDERPQCIHCHRPFEQHRSAGGEYGLCEDCLFDD